MDLELRGRETRCSATFEDGPGHLPALVIAAPTAEARIFLHGAQLTHWRPTGAQPVIFLSEKSNFEEGHAIRGGVPVCFPWFGPLEGESSHGFLRNRTWNGEEVQHLDGGLVRAVFTTESDEETRVRWPYDYAIRLTYTVGATLTMELEVESRSSDPFTFSEALHTYFVVGDIRKVVIKGLENTEYRDVLDRSEFKVQQGPIYFGEEIDRIFVNTRETCVLEDPELKRRIIVKKENSDSTTVWNPWKKKAAALADFGDDEWQRMVCIETANAFENEVTLEPGQRHRMTAEISVEAI